MSRANAPTLFKEKRTDCENSQSVRSLFETSDDI
jgi:hypothetical protein